ncbi:hypothetical protein [Halomonas sp. E14]|uniref:hypothetical protein n=1 Tax=Halomonas sp. E14 TaxID=3397245 RepID=UPI00403E98F7
MKQVSVIGDAIKRAHGLWDFIDSGGEAAKRLSDLQRALVEAQIRETALIEENAALKQTVAGYEQFEIEKQHYEAEQLPSSAWVMRLRVGVHVDTHLAQQGMQFCTQCFFKRQLSILQPLDKRSTSCRFLKCHVCSSEVMIDPPPRGCVDVC